MIIFLLILIFLAVLWPRALKFTLALLLLIGLWNMPSHADGQHCQGAWELSGMYFHGAAICNPALTKSKGYVTAKNFAFSCRMLTENDESEAINAGITAFDLGLHNVGRKAACAALNKSITETVR